MVSLVRAGNAGEVGGVVVLGPLVEGIGAVPGGVDRGEAAWSALDDVACGGEREGRQVGGRTALRGSPVRSGRANQAAHPRPVRLATAGGDLAERAARPPAADAQPGKAEATLAHSGTRATVSQAAWVNGTLGHSAEYDDAQALAGHTNSAVIPAALALAEREAASGRALITAVVAGIQVMGLLGAALPKMVTIGWHGSKVLGVYGAAGRSACHGKARGRPRCGRPLPGLRAGARRASGGSSKYA
jgi:MmgE/PrpD N-terminal domain